MKKKIKSKKKRLLIIIVAVIVIIAIISAVFISRRNKFAMPEMNIRTAERMTIEKTIESDGEIQSSLEENIAPHTSYYLKSIDVSEGDALAEGDKILTYSNGNTLTAPYDCVVESWVLPESGAQLTSDHYVTIAGTDVLMIELSVDEDDITNVEPGDAAKINVEATGSTYEGEVSYVSEVGTYSGGTSTFKAKIEFDNDGEIKLGMTGTATVSLAKAENVIAVPAAAVHTLNGSSYVTVANDKTGKNTSEVQVQTGLSNDSYIAVIAGLDEGAGIVVPETEEGSSSFSFSGGFPGGGGGMPGGGSGGEMPSKMPGGERSGGMPSDGPS